MANRDPWPMSDKRFCRYMAMVFAVFAILMLCAGLFGCRTLTSNEVMYITSTVPDRCEDVLDCNIGKQPQ